MPFSPHKTAFLYVAVCLCILLVKAPPTQSSLAKPAIDQDLAIPTKRAMGDVTTSNRHSWHSNQNRQQQSPSSHFPAPSAGALVLSNFGERSIFTPRQPQSLPGVTSTGRSPPQPAL
ncbi:MAG: hypothetical protein U0R19_31230 [Bryobacteraceae bacterium]